MAETTYKNLLYDQDGAVVTITFNRPQALNAINKEMIDEITASCQRADADPTVKVIIIKGAGRSFSAGFDMSGEGPKRTWPGGLLEGMDIGTHLDYMRKRQHGEWRNQLLFGEMDKPVIGQIHGYCIGGGTWYALSMDITIAGESAVFAQAEIRHGDGGSFVWASRCGWSNALRYQLTGDHIDAREALRIGAVNEVVPDDQLDAHVMKLAKRIALLPMESIKLNKAMIRKGMDMMGFRNAQMMAVEISSMVETSWLDAYHARWDKLQEEGGLKAFLEDRDAPYLPEPFGPRSKMTSFERKS